MKEWNLEASASEVLDALALWMGSNPRWTYTLSVHEDYHVKKWLVELKAPSIGDSVFTLNGRGDTPHEATVEAFNLAGVPHPYETGEVFQGGERLHVVDDVTEDDGIKVMHIPEEQVVRELREGP